MLYFLFGRGKTRGPSKLNVKANEDFSKSIVKNSELPTSNEAKPKMTVLEPENIVDMKMHVAKNMSVYFVYNGHEWEAHEVLGVAAGSSMPKVTEAYQKLIITSDPSTFEFFESAYRAILVRWKDRL